MKGEFRDLLNSTTKDMNIPKWFHEVGWRYRNFDAPDILSFYCGLGCSVSHRELEMQRGSAKAFIRLVEGRIKQAVEEAFYHYHPEYRIIRQPAKPFDVTLLRGL